VAPVAVSTTKHNKAALGHAKLTQNSMFTLSTMLQVIEHQCRLTKCN
jgi:hypothetical protein